MFSSAVLRNLVAAAMLATLHSAFAGETTVAQPKADGFSSGGLARLDAYLRVQQNKVKKSGQRKYHHKRRA